MSRQSIKLNLTASWGAHAISLVIGFLLMPFVLRTLGDAAYGSWLFLNSIASYAGLMYLGFGDTIGRYVSKYHSEQNWEWLNRTVNIVFAVYSSMSLLALGIACLLAWVAPSWQNWGPESVHDVRLAILILGLNIAVGMTGSAFGGILMGIQRFDLERSIMIAADLLRAGLTFFFVQHNSGLVILSLIFLVVTVLENLAYVIVAFAKVPQLKLHWKYLHRDTAKECFGFSAFAFLNSIASQLIYATDALVIGVYLGNEAIIPYNIAMRLCHFIRRPIQQIGEVCMPKAGQLQADANGGSLRKLVIRSLGVALLLTCGLFIGTAFFGDAVIRTWVGEKYVDSHQILMILLGVQMVALPLHVLRSIMFGLGHVRGPSLMYLLEAVANFTLSLLLVKPLGVLGVAIGTAVPIVIVELGLLLPYVLRTLKLRFWETVTATVGPQIVPLIALAAYSLIVERQFEITSGWSKLIPVTVGGGVVLAGTWLLQSRCGRLLQRVVPEAPAAPAN